MDGYLSNRASHIIVGRSVRGHDQPIVRLVVCMLGSKLLPHGVEALHRPSEHLQAYGVGEHQRAASHSNPYGASLSLFSCLSVFLTRRFIMPANDWALARDTCNPPRDAGLGVAYDNPVSRRCRRLGRWVNLRPNKTYCRPLCTFVQILCLQSVKLPCRPACW